MIVAVAAVENGHYRSLSNPFSAGAYKFSCCRCCCCSATRTTVAAAVVVVVAVSTTTTTATAAAISWLLALQWPSFNSLNE